MDTKLDLVFLIDGTQALSLNTFSICLGFVKSFTASLDVSKEGTHVGITVYGASPELVIAFDDHHDQSSLGRAVDNVNYPGAFRSNLGAALSLVASGLYNTSAARLDANRVLVILTGSICQDEVAIPSFQLQKNYGVKIFVIGVGNQYSLGQMREIASDPDNDHVVTVSSGSDLSFYISIVRETIAEGKWLAIAFFLAYFNWIISSPRSFPKSQYFTSCIMRHLSVYYGVNII